VPEALRHHCQQLPTLLHHNVVALLAVAVLSLMVLVVPSPASAVRTDIVILDNEDRITGDIKSLERGLLKLKTDAADNILIQWVDIKRLISKDTFEIETTNGRHYFGVLAPIDGANKLHIIGVLDSLVIDFNKIVFIVPIKNTFWSRIDGSVDLGVSFTQANNLLQWSFAGEVKYRAPKFYSRLAVDSSISDQKDVKRTSRQDLSLRNTRFWNGKS